MTSAESLLHEARQLGFLGPGPIERHIEHARAYAAATTLTDPDLAVDLGSGGGLPVLVLIAMGFGRRWLLVERSRTRADWLERAIRRLGAADRVEVHCRKAEMLAATELLGTVDLVTARSFAPLPITAEVAAPMLRPGGEMVVSLDTDRSVPASVAALDLRLEVVVVDGHPFCRARRGDAATAGPPRSWRAMQRSPRF